MDQFTNKLVVYLKENTLDGLAKGMTIDDLAKKHRVPVDLIRDELEKGTTVEIEHTKDERMAQSIAMDHLFEMPDYYTRLHAMEKAAENAPAHGEMFTYLKIPMAEYSD